MRSIPSTTSAGKKLQPITGTPIDLLNMPKGCPFAPRCDAAMKICIHERAPRIQINDCHQAACWMNEKKIVEAAYANGDAEVDAMECLLKAEFREDAPAADETADCKTSETAVAENETNNGEGGNE